MDDASLSQVRDAVVQAWNLPQASTGALVGRAAILEAIARRVRHLPDQDFDRLLSAMYLLDVSEEGFRSALAGGDSQSASEKLAGIILEREIEKMKSRERYSRGADSDDR